MPIDLVGDSKIFREVTSRLPAMARSSAVVLIRGETGTGKNLVARMLHDLGPRHDRPFVVAPCGTMLDDKLEHELFGDASDGAQRGLLAQAKGGTLYLDKVDLLSRGAQVALMRALPDSAVQSFGDRRSAPDVRFIASTHGDLEALVRQGAFRADLYYRLRVLAVDLPPLRARREDIPSLVRHFVNKHAPEFDPMPRFSPRAMEAMSGFDWPGNVRELESAIVRGLSTALGDVIEPEDLGLSQQAGGNGAPWKLAVSAALPYKPQKQQLVQAFEHEYLIQLMTLHHGNVTHAARSAGKERRDLGKLLKRHGLDRREFNSVRALETPSES